MQTLRLAVNAMATRFELVLPGTDEIRLRAAGEEALREIGVLDRRLSVYSDKSELSRLNAAAADGPVSVAPDLFELLRMSLALSIRTKGAFDPTVGPLMKAWGFFRGSGRLPASEAVEDAKAVSGFRHVRLNDTDRTVAFDLPGVELDLGGIAKGYAMDEAVAILRAHGVRDALFHGGTSTVVALGTSYDGTPWRVGIADGETILATVALENTTLSVSAVSGRAFSDGERVYGHVIDPRTGQPTSGAAVAAVVSDRATDSDALSTATLVLGKNARFLADGRTGLAVWGGSLPDSLLFESGLPGFFQDPNLTYPESPLPENGLRGLPGGSDSMR